MTTAMITYKQQKSVFWSQTPCPVWRYFLMSFLALFSTVNQANFVPVELPKDLALTSAPAALCTQARHTESYLNKYDTSQLGSGLPSIFTAQALIETLRYICDIAKQDKANGNVSRLSNAVFINQQFQVYQWTGNPAQIKQAIQNTQRAAQKKRLLAIPDKHILLTKYYIKKADASATRTEKYSQALYSLPKDEHGDVSDSSAAQVKQPIRLQYTRQQIIAGALLDNPDVTAIAWVTQDDLHDIMMQGSVMLSIDGKSVLLNVHKNNGIPYDYALGKQQQQRYWYFKPTPQILGFGINSDHKLPILPHVTVAADIDFLGLGTFMLLANQQHTPRFSRLVLTGDTGGAFTGNQFQLDLLVGAHKQWADYQIANQHLPPDTKAYVLLKRNK